MEAFNAFDCHKQNAERQQKERHLEAKTKKNSNKFLGITDAQPLKMKTNN